MIDMEMEMLNLIREVAGMKSHIAGIQSQFATLWKFFVGIGIGVCLNFITNVAGFFKKK